MADSRDRRRKSKLKSALGTIVDKRQAVPGIEAIRSGFARHTNISVVVVGGVTRVSAVSWPFMVIGPGHEAPREDFGDPELPQSTPASLDVVSLF